VIIKATTKMVSVDGLRGAVAAKIIETAPPIAAADAKITGNLRIKSSVVGSGIPLVPTSH
jgi:hypothetical protein